MQITTVKAMVAKVLMAGFVAGALVMAAPAKASAQEVIVRANVGPVFVPAAFGYDRYDRDRGFRRHEEWERSQRRFVHDQYRRGDRGYGYR